jgi:hypothetical protein
MCIGPIPNGFRHRPISLYSTSYDRLCGLVIRVSGYRSRGPGFDSVPYQIFWELRSYLNEKVAAPVYKTEINGVGNSFRWPRNTLYPQKFSLNSPTSGGRSVGIVRLRTKATEFSFFFFFKFLVHCPLCRRATRHVLTRVAKCIDVDGGIFGKCIILGELYKLCHLNNKYRY